MDTALSEAREAVLEWRAIRDMPAPRLARGEPIHVVRAELRIAFEQRSLEAESEAAPAGSPFGGQASRPDPWALELDAPTDGRAWSERRALPEHRSIEACPVCRGARRFTCDDCGGAGYKLEHYYEPITGMRVTRTIPCGTCAGATTVPCGGCGGTALVRVTPILVAETGVRARRTLIHDGALPDELVSEMRDAPSARLFAEKRIHAAEGSVLPASPWGEGRRPPSGIAARVADGIVQLCTEPLTNDERVCGWSLEVVEGYVVSFRMTDRQLHVWGSPVRVSGDDEPVKSDNTRLLLVGLGVLGLGAAGAIAWMLQ